MSLELMVSDRFTTLESASMHYKPKRASPMAESSLNK